MAVLGPGEMAGTIFLVVILVVGSNKAVSVNIVLGVITIDVADLVLTTSVLIALSSMERGRCATLVIALVAVKAGIRIRNILLLRSGSA